MGFLCRVSRCCFGCCDVVKGSLILGIIGIVGGFIGIGSGLAEFLLNQRPLEFALKIATNSMSIVGSAFLVVGIQKRSPKMVTFRVKPRLLTLETTFTRSW